MEDRERQLALKLKTMTSKLRAEQDEVCTLICGSWLIRFHLCV